jgi:Rad3-related DNA helicase
MPLVVSHGVKQGQVFDFSYKNRDNVEMIKDLGETIVEVCKTVTGGILVFFPSYPLMN